MYDVLQQRLSIGDYVWRSSTGPATKPMILGQLTRIQLKRSQRCQDFTQPRSDNWSYPYHETRCSGIISITVGGVAFRFDVGWDMPDDPLETAICKKILLATPEQIERFGSLGL